MSAARVRVVVRWFATVAALVKAVIAYFVALAAFGGIVSIIEGETQSGPVARGALVTLCVVLLLAGLWVGSSLFRVAFARKAYLEVRDDAIVITHPGIFRKPVLIPRDLISVAAFDDRPASWRRFRDHKRFHLAGEMAAADGHDEPDWLYSKEGGSPLPLLSHVHDVPNIALLFTHPIRLRPARRAIKPFPAKTNAHPPLHGHRSRGLLIHVRDIEPVREAFAAWGIARPLMRPDIYAVEPTGEEMKGARRLLIRTNAILVGVILLQGAAPLLVHALGGPEPLAAPERSGSACTQLASIRVANPIDPHPEGQMDPGSLTLKTDLLIDEDAMRSLEPSLRFVDEGREGIGDFAPEGSDLEERMVRHDFRESFYREWTGQDKHLVVAFSEFGTARDAADFTSWIEGWGCVNASAAFSVGRVKGAAGFRFPQGPGEEVREIRFVRGNRVYLVTAQGTVGDELRLFVERIAVESARLAR